MSLWKIAWRSVQQRAVASSLTALSMALGVALVVIVLVILSTIDNSFKRSAQGYDLIVGAKGGKLQLVLNTVYHLSTPVENIPYSYYKEFTKDTQHTGRFAKDVDIAIPYCLGDNYEGYRVVGTTPAMFDNFQYAAGKSYSFSSGRNFKHENFFEAVVGSLVARRTGLKIGDKFEPTHGVSEDSPGHKHDAFTVVGVLSDTGTPNDRALFVNMEGFFLLQGHAKEAPAKTPRPAGKKAATNPAGKAHDHKAHARGAVNPHNHQPGDASHAEDEHEDADHDHHDHAAGEHAAHDDEDDHDAHGHAGHDDDSHAAHEHEPGDADHDHDDHDAGEHATHDDDAHKAAKPHKHKPGAASHAEHAHEGASHNHNSGGHAAHGDQEHGHDEHGHDEHGHAGHDHGHNHKPLPEALREVTAILVRTNPQNVLAAITLPRTINKDSVAQAVQPAREIYNLFDSIVGNLRILLLVLAVLVVVVAGIGIMVSIYNSMSERRREIAIMRSLGARRQTVLNVILLESILLAVGGGLGGWLLGHTVIGLLSPLVVAHTGVSLSFLEYDPYELVLAPGLILLASVAGFLPALTAYKTDVASALSNSP